MRKVVCFVVVLFAMTAGTGIWASDGKDVYLGKCGSCHRGGGEAPVFAPTKYASVQWERFFDRDKHSRKKDISGVLSADEMAAVKQYLMEHAADSDQPEAAGLR